jgi:hypothetical protein
MFSFTPPSIDQIIQFQTPISMMPPTATPRIQMPQLSIPSSNAQLLHPDFCTMIRTADRLLPVMPPLHYDVSGSQPLGLIGLKNAYNDIASQLFDGTIGVAHPLEPFMQAQMLENLNSQINEYCYPK